MRSDRIHAFLEGVLSESEEARLFEELSRDPHLRDRFRRAVWMHQALRMRAPLPEDFTERVMAALPRRVSEPGWRAWLLRGWRALWVPRPIWLRPLWVGSGVALMLLALLLGLPRSGSTPAEVQAEAPTVLHRVRLAVPIGPARQVAVAGTFNNWSTEAWLLEDPDGDGIWTGEILLPPGRYEYIIVVDGEHWMPDPTATMFVEDGFGRRNAVLLL